MEAGHRRPTDQSDQASGQPLARLREEKSKPHWIICGTNANLRGIGLFAIFLSGTFAVYVIILNNLFS